MEKRELLKKLIVDICNNKAYEKAVFRGENDEYFAFNEGMVHVLEYDDLDYFSIHFTPEEKQEVEKIENELKLSDSTFLPIRGGAVDDLEGLLEYYTMYADEDEEDPGAEKAIDEIERLQAVFEDKNSIFYHRESHFLELFLFPEIEISDEPYVRCDWDHDEAYYYDLPFSTGVCDLLYDVVVGEDSFVELDCTLDCVVTNTYLTEEEQEEEYDRWIEVLSNIGSYII